MRRPNRLAGLLLAVAVAAPGGDGWAQVVPPGTAPAWPLATDPQSVQVLRLVEGQVDGAASPALSPQQWRAILLSAVDRHPEARGAEHATAAAGAATRETQAAALPQLELRADAGHRRNDPSTLLDTPFRRFDSAGLALSLRQLVHDFGAVSAATDSGLAREAALAARADQRRLDLGLRVVAAWVDLVRVRQQQALMALNVTARQGSVDDLDQRYRLGAGLASDIWRAQARLADAQAAQARAQARLAGAEAAWRELLGDLPAQVTWPPMPTAGATAAHGSPVIAPDFPALRSAEAALRAAELEQLAVERRTRPQVALEASALRRDLAGSGVPGTDLSLALALRYTFYSGGADNARVAQSTARSREAAEQVRGIALQVERAHAEALGDDAAAQQVLDSRRQEARLAVASLAALRELFASRRGSLLDLLTAQESLHAAAMALVDAQADQIMARWRLAYFQPWLVQALRRPAGTLP